VWVKGGHQVMFSSRHPEELKDLVTRLGPSAHAGTVAEAVAFGDVVLLAVPYRAMPDLAKEFAPALARKVLVFDACNPYPNRDGDVARKVQEAGAGTYAAMLFPGAHIVRAFNAIHAARFGEGGHDSHGAQVGIPIAGDDRKAIAVASDLIDETGFEPVLVGSLAFGNNLVPGAPLAGEHTPEEIRKIAATLK
jgi:predicted dinucleotide-binding enzyme